MTASDGGFPDMVRILLDTGADARQYCRSFTALRSPCSNGHLGIVELLVNHDTSLVNMGKHMWAKPLFAAIEQGHSEIVRFLLSRGANVSSQLLMKACRKGNLDRANVAGRWC